MTTHFDVSKFQRWAAIPLRLIVGYGFIAHGYAKVVNGPDHFAAALQGLGVPAPHLAAWATIGFELLGGFAVLGGACIPLISIPLTVICTTSISSTASVSGGCGKCADSRTRAAARISATS